MAAIGYDDIVAHLAGLDAWLQAAARSDAKFDRQHIERHIPGWLRRFERETTFRLGRVQVVAAPDGTYDSPTAGTGTLTSSGTIVTGAGTSFLSQIAPDMELAVGSLKMPVKSVESDMHLTLYDIPPVPWVSVTFNFYPMPVVVSSGYPYYRSDAREYLETTLRERPVIDVQRVRMLLNGQQEVIRFPREWYSFERNGRFWILPVNATAAITGLAAAMAIYSLTYANEMPNFVHFDYIAGLPFGWQYSSEWADVRHAVECWCALQVLSHIDQSFGAGLSGKSVSSAIGSQNFQYTRFQDKKQEFQQEVQSFKDTLTAQETPYFLDYV